MRRKTNSTAERKQMIRDYFDELDQHLLPASIATLKRRKQTLPTESCFGGVFAGKSDSTWPEVNGKPLEGVLQIRIKDLPFRPKELDNVALIQIFVPCDSDPQGGMVYPTDAEGDGVVVRTFSSLRGLRAVKKPYQSQIKPCRIKWSRVDNEIPSYLDFIGLVDAEKQERFWNLKDWAKIQKRHYGNNPRTKVGGWPNSCQNGLNYRGYAVQIGSEYKANFAWGHDGTAVVYRIRKRMGARLGLLLKSTDATNQAFHMHPNPRAYHGQS